MGPTAYVNWKRVNLSLKNQYGSALGPLYNALSYEMRGSVGNALLKFPEMQPRSNMTGAEITKFIKEDPDYEWVKKIPDQTLTKYLDKATWLKYASYMYNYDLSALPSASEST